LLIFYGSLLICQHIGEITLCQPLEKFSRKKAMHPTGDGTGPFDQGFASDDFPDPSIFLHFDPPDPCFFMPDEIVP